MKFIASARGAANSATIDTETTLDISAGDVLVAFAGGDSPVISGVAEDDATNAFTVLGVTAEWRSIGCAYRVSASASTGATIRVTLSPGFSDSIDIIVLQFRPESGETVTYGGGPASAGASWGSNPTSGQLSTEESKSMWVGGAISGNAITNNVIGGSEVTGIITGLNYNFEVGYIQFEEAKSNIAYSTSASNSTWGAQLLYFNISESGGGHPTASRFRNMHRNNSVRYA